MLTSASRVEEVTAGNADARSAALRLFVYCQANGWAGHDPYDALNSQILQRMPFRHSQILRLIATQALKRSPIDLRRLLRVPTTQNAKAIALFLSALLKFEGKHLLLNGDLVPYMVARLSALQSQGKQYSCWGYNFPWQTRTVEVLSGEPNLVCTTFAAGALLDVYERRKASECLDMAVSAASYILSELYWSKGTTEAGFSYPLASERNQVHNANLLAAALLCRVYRHTGNTAFLEPALRVVRCSTARQQKNGAWYYGEAASQRWIDNFHTGYNLCALNEISRDANTNEFDASLRRGFDFYKTHFFCGDGSVKYFHDSKYPIDIHCVAQSIITLQKLQHLDDGNVALADSVFHWAMKHMWDDRGFFYYQVLRSCTIKISYMRWSQAWMFLALATMLDE